MNKTDHIYDKISESALSEPSEPSEIFSIFFSLKNFNFHLQVLRRYGILSILEKQTIETQKGYSR
jgi:hypothetical protein